MKHRQSLRVTVIGLLMTDVCNGPWACLSYTENELGVAILRKRSPENIVLDYGQDVKPLETGLLRARILSADSVIGFLLRSCVVPVIVILECVGCVNL